MQQHEEIVVAAGMASLSLIPWYALEVYRENCLNLADSDASLSVSSFTFTVSSTSTFFHSLHCLTPSVSFLIYSGYLTLLDGSLLSLVKITS